MKSNEYVFDLNGKKVHVGDIVKVLEIDKNIILEEGEKEMVMSMVGNELEVDEIDEYGCAWVTKWFELGDEESEAHGIALESNQMELIRSEKSE